MPSTEPNPQLARIMDAYGRAWETHDADLVLSLFTDDATYQENPFSAPMEGHGAIRKYWQEATGPHRDIEFRWERVGSSGETHFVEWVCSYSRADVKGRLELRGIMLIELRGRRIFRFREYWVRQQNVPSS